MRTRTYLAPALEAAPTPKLRVISVEEEALITDEAANIASNVEQDLDGANRTLEVSDAMEDIAVVADGVEKATPQETALVDTALQMVVAGTDIAPEDVVPGPAMESFIGGKIAIENLRETAAKIYENVMAFVKKVFDNIVKYFRIGVIVPNLEKRIEDFEARLKDAGPLKKDSGKLELSSSLLMIGEKAPKDNREFVLALGQNVQTAKYVFEENAKKVAKLGTEIAQAVGKFTAETSAETVEEVRALLAKTKYQNPPGAKTGVTEGDFKVTRGVGLVGGGSLVLKEYTAQQGASPLGALDRYRRSGVSYDPPKLTGAEVQISFDAFSVKECEEYLDDAKLLLKYLKDFHGGVNLKGLEATQKLMNQASDKAKQALAKVPEADKGHAETVNNFRALVNFNAAYANWVYSPAMPFYAKSISVVRAVLVLVAESINKFEGKEGPAT